MNNLLIKISLFVILINSFNTYSQKTIFYNIDWKETTKDKASFYRPYPKKTKGLWIIIDFYITGEKQFKGYAKDSLGTILEGDATWYFKTGKVQDKIRYKNGKTIGSFAAIEGTKGSSKEGWNENDLYYYGKQMVDNAIESTKTNVYKTYYENSKQLAREHTSIVGDEDKTSYTLFFDKRGDTIGKLLYNEFSNKWTGKEVTFYEIKKGDTDIILSIKEIHTYQKGTITNTQHFNTSEKLIAEGSFVDTKKYNGTFLKDACRFIKIQNFKNGNLQNETTFTNDFKKLGLLTYRNNEPETGTYYDCNNLQKYKNGKLHGKSTTYLYAGSKEMQSFFNYKNGLKHGSYSIFEDVQLLLEKGTYKNGAQVGDVYYYHNGAHNGQEFNHNYYIKNSIKSNKTSSYVSKLSQYDLDTNQLIKTYNIHYNKENSFVYLNNGYHTLKLDDINNDGNDDLIVHYDSYLEEKSFSTYYLYNTNLQKYEYLKRINDVKAIDFSSKNNNFTFNFTQYNGDSNRITYTLNSKKEFEKIKEVETLRHQIADTITTTQLFPISTKKYPLLDKKTPPLTFVQKNKKYSVTKPYQEISLKKAPFALEFPIIHNGSTFLPLNIKARIIASYNNNVSDLVPLHAKLESLNSFQFGSSYAMDIDDTETTLIIEEGYYHAFHYNNSKNDNTSLVKHINDTISIVQFTVTGFLDTYLEQRLGIDELNKPIYLIIYLDTNSNLKIDKGEVKKIKLQFID